MLTLLDVNDNAPVFSLMEYQGSIVEDDSNPHPQAVYVVRIAKIHSHRVKANALAMSFLTQFSGNS